MQTFNNLSNNNFGGCVACDGSGFHKMYRFDIIERWQEEHYSAKEAFELYRLWKYCKNTWDEYSCIPCEFCRIDEFSEAVRDCEDIYDKKQREARDQRINNDMLLSTIRDITLNFQERNRL